MPNEIPKNTAYVIGGVGQNSTGVSDLKGYVTLSSGASSSTPKIAAYVSGSMADGVGKTAANIVLSNPAAITNDMTYVLATSAARESTTSTSKGYGLLYSFFPPYEDVVTSISFIEERFPVCVSFGSSGGPGFKTNVFEVDSGLTSVDIEWDRIRSRYQANFDHVPPQDIEEVEKFFYGMKGMGVGFRYKDWSDFTISNQNIFVGDGITTTFQLFKRYTSGSNFFDRIIRKPIDSTFQLTLNGSLLILNQDYFVNNSTGEITFQSPPPNNFLGTIIQAEFDVPVRFDSDFLNVSYEDYAQLNISGIDIIEVLT